MLPPLSPPPPLLIIKGLFEGMKAVRRKDGAIVVFRPEMNARRMAAGARRLCLPPVPEKLFLQVCVHACLF
jgi:branched-chain amino acid aminotransferase